MPSCVLHFGPTVPRCGSAGASTHSQSECPGLYRCTSSEHSSTEYRYAAIRLCRVSLQHTNVNTKMHSITNRRRTARDSLPAILMSISLLHSSFMFSFVSIATRGNWASSRLLEGPKHLHIFLVSQYQRRFLPT